MTQTKTEQQTVSATPGPWTVHSEQTYGRSFKVLGAPQRDERYPAMPVQVVPEVALFVKAHDASLIAAAPELLAALKALVDEVERKDNPCDEGASMDCDEMSAARAAIAKAEGQ